MACRSRRSVSLLRRFTEETVMTLSTGAAAEGSYVRHSLLYHCECRLSCMRAREGTRLFMKSFVNMRAIAPPQRAFAATGGTESRARRSAEIRARARQDNSNEESRRL